MKRDSSQKTSKLTERSASRAEDSVFIRKLAFKVIAGPDRGGSYDAASERTVVGTHRSVDFVLRDPTVSRFHCEMTVEGATIRIRDLGSLNGTVVAGVRIADGFLGKPAVLVLGDTSLRLELQRDLVALALSP